MLRRKDGVARTWHHRCGNRKVNGNAVHVEVGSVLHPMEEEHLITMIVLETTKGFEVKQLSAGEAPKADFAVCPDEKPVAVYEYCNLHGLWKTEL